MDNILTLKSQMRALILIFFKYKETSRCQAAVKGSCLTAAFAQCIWFHLVEWDDNDGRGCHSYNGCSHCLRPCLDSPSQN